MERKNEPAVEPAEHELVITRVFDAPLDLVWKAHTESERLMKWWGPKGFKMIVAKLDFRPGGIFHYGMKSPDGHEMWGKFIYREIIPGKKFLSSSPSPMKKVVSHGIRLLRDGR